MLTLNVPSQKRTTFPLYKAQYTMFNLTAEGQSLYNGQSGQFMEAPLHLQLAS